MLEVGVRTGGVPTDWQYTGQETDGTGLVYLHARSYDSARGQFLSPETLVPDPEPVYACDRSMCGDMATRFMAASTRRRLTWMRVHHTL